MRKQDPELPPQQVREDHIVQTNLISYFAAGTPQSDKERKQ